MKKIIGITTALLIACTISSQNIENYTSNNGLCENYVKGSLVVDKNGTVWFGTANGVCSYNGIAWNTYTMQDGLIDDYINTIAATPNHQIWVGTDLGVSYFNGSQWQNFTTQNSTLISNEINHIYAAKDTSIWIASDYGVSKFKNGVFTSYTTNNGLPVNTIKYITEDMNNNIIFGSFMGGFIIYNGNTFQSITENDGLIDNNVFCITTSITNNWKYIGTLSGVSIFDNNLQHIKDIKHTDGLINEHVRSIGIDHYDNLWIGLYADYDGSGGVAVYKENNIITTYTMEQGLADNQVIGLDFSDNNSVWVATGNGASKITYHTSIAQNEKTKPYQIINNGSKPLIKCTNQSIHIKINDTSGKLISEIQLKAGETFSFDHNYNCVFLNILDDQHKNYFEKIFAH